MKFQPYDKEPNKDYLLVTGVYFHGNVADAIGYDCVEIAKEDAEPFRLLVNESSGIEGMPVDVEGYGKALLYAWKSNMGVPMVANPPFETLWFRGFIVDPDDEDALKDAKESFNSKKQAL